MDKPKVVKLRPDRADLVRDALEAHMNRSEDFILISIGEEGVEMGSTLDDERGLFYIEIAKQMIINDWMS